MFKRGPYIVILNIFLCIWICIDNFIYTMDMGPVYRQSNIIKYNSSRKHQMNIKLTIHK